MKRVLLLVLGCFLLLPASAGAITLAPGSTVHDPQINQWLDTAATYWQKTPNCPAVIQVTAAANDDQTIVARATTPGCSLELMSAWYPKPPGWDAQYGAEQWNHIMCIVLVHEYGHLLGYGHSPDPNNIMYVQPSFAVPGCPTWDPNTPVGTTPVTGGTTTPLAKIQATTSLQSTKTRWQLTTVVKNPGATSLPNIQICQTAPTTLPAGAAKTNKLCKTVTVNAHGQQTFRSTFRIKPKTTKQFLVTVHAEHIQNIDRQCTIKNAARVICKSAH